MLEADSKALSNFWQVIDGLDPDRSLKLREKLEGRWINPPTCLFSTVLERDDVTAAEVQQLLFAPNSTHMGLYAQLLLGDPQHVSDLGVAANKAQIMVLSHMYLVHGRCWNKLRPFIEAGGLRQLVQLLTHPQHVLASQALELLICATHPDMNNWDPPAGQVQQPEAGRQDTTSDYSSCSTSSSASGASSGSAKPLSSSTSSADVELHASSKSPSAGGSSRTLPAALTSAAEHPAAGPDGQIWRELMQLQSGPLLGSLLSLSPDVWPGSGYMALQFLTFYLNWLRKWWCQDGVLKLSDGLLSGLSAWSVRATASKEERQLAAQLVADFGKHGPAQTGLTAGEAVVCCGPELEVRVVADRTLVNSRPGSEAERLKAAGNEAFKAKGWSLAIQLYSAALDVPVPHEALPDEASRRATYHANRAAAYLARYKEAQATTATAQEPAVPCEGSSNSNKGSEQCSAFWREVGGVLDGQMLDGASAEARGQLLQAAMIDCRAALDLVPTHTKAHYRLATALQAQGRLSSAEAAARSAEQHATCHADRAAAAQLVASIVKQASQLRAGQQHTLRGGHLPVPVGQARAGQGLQDKADPVGTAAATKPPTGSQQTADSSHCSGSSSSSNRSSYSSSTNSNTQLHEQQPQQQQGHAPRVCAADAVDQLLQQFATVIKQQSSQASAETAQPATASPLAGTKGNSRSAGVLLPLLAQQQQQQPGHGPLSDQLVLPGHAVRPGKQTAARKPLIEELPDP